MQITLNNVRRAIRIESLRKKWLESGRKSGDFDAALSQAVQKSDAVNKKEHAIYRIQGVEKRLDEWKERVEIASRQGMHDLMQEALCRQRKLEEELAQLKSEAGESN